MNVDVFNGIADLIEYTDRFNLSEVAIDDDGKVVAAAQRVWNDCGTTACIWGWVNTWADNKLDDEAAARRELGIGDRQGERLFYAYRDSVWVAEADYYGWTLNEWGEVADWSEITATQAADMLRRIAKGEVEL